VTCKLIVHGTSFDMYWF